MDDAHRSVIQSNYASLVEQTDLDLMVTALYEKGVFSEHMIERYKDQRHDVRHRKRQLYMDVMTRGPNAFGHLIDALTEAGYWDLARDLDPNSHLHTGNRRPSPSNDKFISIRTEKQKTKTIATGTIDNKPKPTPKPVDIDNNPLHETAIEIPHFEVKKATKFVEDDDIEGGIKVYRMRGRPRGVLLVFSYTKFQDNWEEPRPGVEVDDAALKKLFGELGFKLLFYTNLPKNEVENTLRGLNTVLEGMECLFTVVSSHGYGRPGSYDNDFRCYDNKLMSIYEFLEYFNNKNLHVMKGLPKVFIFQICRGTTVDWEKMPMPRDSARDGCVFTDEAPEPPRSAPPPRAAGRDRVYSDILIAHSTVPGVVSWRDVKRGSWYIQALCAEFAARAHEAHVEELFTHVDRRLAAHPAHAVQTSSVDRWGFNRRLYLHPGLYE